MGNRITDELPASLENKLQDFAQIIGGLDYTDISNFAKKATKADIVKAKKLANLVWDVYCDDTDDETVYNDPNYKALLKLMDAKDKFHK